MKYLLYLPLIAAANAFGKDEPCPLNNLSTLDYADLECQFYLGTMAYRANLYSVAAAHWQYVVDTPAKYEEDEEIKTDAIGTITYLTYHGLGVKQDKNNAVKMWELAAIRGNLEARRHLGDAYSDDDYSHKDLIKSLGWYESVILSTSGKGQQDNIDTDILNDAQDKIKSLKNILSKKDEQAALRFARSTLKGKSITTSH